MEWGKSGNRKPLWLWAVFGLLAVAFGAAVLLLKPTDEAFDTNALPVHFSESTIPSHHEQVATDDLIPPDGLAPDVSQPESKQVESGDSIPEMQTEGQLTSQPLLDNLDSPTPSVRGKAAMDLYRQMQQMSDRELNRFWDRLLNATERNPCQDDWLELTWVLNMVAHAMMERELLTQQCVDQALAFLAEYASDPNQSAHNRRIAIQTIGMAGVSSAGPAIATLLEDPQNWEVEEIARSAAVALAALDHPGAASKIARIIESTDSQSIGDSAAYALGEIGQLSAVPHLVAYRERTGSNLSPDTALRKMRPDIVEAIQDIGIPKDQRIACIQATVAFYSEEHASNQDYLKPLGDIIVNPAAEPEIRIAATRQILKHTRMADFQDGIKILGPLVSYIAEIPELEDEFAEIQARLNARPIELTPIDEKKAPTQ
jgi:HEAT repeat protein